MSDDLAIRVEGVGKTFKLPHEKNSSIKSAVINFYKRKKTFEKQQALDNISFDVKKGEFFGIVGRNGSGKSTLLKLLAGIYTPDIGTIQINGKLTPFIELGVGFNPELTGRENVFLNCALLGFSRKETGALYDDIVAFAEIKRFMDQKLKNYSSGMQVRLAFSIAIRAQSGILLFDEVLAVGDAAFQQKCYDIFETMTSDGRTVVLVTHDMSAVQRFCNRAILIDKGSIMMAGDPSEIADKYLEQNYSGQAFNDSRVLKEEEKKFAIKDISLTSGSGNATNNFSLHQEVNLSFKLENRAKLSDLRIGLQIFSNTGVYCFGTNTKIDSAPTLNAKDAKIRVSLKQSLVPGTYFITLAIMNNSATKVLQYLPRAATFNVKQESEIQGVTLMGTSWSIQKNV